MTLTFTITMSDPLDELIALSQTTEDDPHAAVRQAFEEALDRAKSTIKCMPDDKEELAEEKAQWAVELENVLVRVSIFVFFRPLTFARNGYGAQCQTHERPGPLSSSKRTICSK